MPPSQGGRKLSPSQRKILVMQQMLTQGCITTREVMTIAGVRRRRAEQIMEDFSGVIQLWRDEQDVWRFCE
jgi:hypothetical protein